jgi:subtilisin family serine protease
MTPTRFALLLTLGVAAGCATSPASTAPAPVPTPAPTTAKPPATAPKDTTATATKEAPRNWQLLDPTTDHVPGISAERAIHELLSGKQPRRTVIVAVIDGGVDTAHVDLRANLWVNPKETGNGKDDDGNGYADDVHGWNFIGGRDGRDVQYDTYEVTRLFVHCAGTAPGSSIVGGLLPAERERCEKIVGEYRKLRTEAEMQIANVRQIDSAYVRILPILRAALGTDSLSVANVTALRPTRGDVAAAKRLYLDLAAQNITPKLVAEAKKELESRLSYGLNPTYNPRAIVGDDTTNINERRYGNMDVTGPDAKHGTHVAGIIGAIRGNSTGIDGIATSVRIMSVRAVPDGDERDKDIANAIRYAVDNGASVINMSFGKGYSPGKAAVDEAVKYADSHGVLMVHAAGNEGANIAVKPSFPTPFYLNGGRAQNWIEVGASGWKGGDSLVASFSNYGKEQVDVFAPGEDILSTIPGNDYERDSGTSMAAPVVSGLAALIMAYYPNLSAADVKKVIVNSVTSYASLSVLQPNDGSYGAKVPFATLSASGGIVNAYNALKLAESMSNSRPQP